MPDEIDYDAVERFGGLLFQAFTGTAVTLLVYLGHELRLFEFLAEGPTTSQGLADRAGLSERHVREWLAGMTTAGFVDYDPEGRSYTLPPEHAAVLTGDAGRAHVSGLLPILGRLAPDLAETFRSGGGLPYSAYQPEFTDLQDADNRRNYDDALVDGYLAAVPELTDRLVAGIRVADIGCGTGHAVNLMAAAFPASDFVGYDMSETAIDRARKEAAETGLGNVRFEVRDVADLQDERYVGEERFGLVTAFDVIHDLARPAEALAAIAHLLTDTGVFVMVDTKLSSYLENNLDVSTATMTYVSSLAHCLQVSLAQHGAGLGAAWGHELATDMLRDAGFADVEITETPRDPFDNIYIARR